MIYFISDKIVWSPLLVGLCLFCGLYFSCRSGFLQVRHFFNMIKLLISDKKSSKGISSFQSFTMSLAGRIGTGNISGTATAIFFGGPGAIFWMWIFALLGAASSFVECSLAQLWKEEVDGQYRGGPAYYIEKGLGWQRYACVFAFFSILACGLLLPGVQSGVVITAFHDISGINKMLLAFVIVFFLGLIIFGGIKRIANAAEIIVPFMAIGYMIGITIVITANIEYLPSMLAVILKSAFGSDAAFGGIIGSAVVWGVKRGAYANEAGMGNAPHAAAAAEVSHPAKQGLIQAFSVYVDTFLICTATAFVMLLTNCYNVVDERTGAMLAEYVPHLEKGQAFTQAALDTVFHGFGGIFIAVALAFFAFTSLLSYYYQAETNLAYVFRDDSKAQKATMLLQLAFLFTVILSAIRATDTIWALGDIGVGVMAWLNIIAIFKLQKPALALLADYESQLKQAVEPVFDPDKLKIKNAILWKKR
ncbi:MAG: alanine/glycine:cation symporter family protein [Bacillota bacterium]